MSLVINTNTMSLNAQRNLSKSNSGLSTSMERLSSGLRINKAADDAAGLAIASRMTTQISGMNQAARNANDGISLAQTAEGALQELTNNLQRIRELAVQAANDSNSDSDREALDAEVQQRLAEIDRTAAQTSFNGRRVLDGSFGTATFQVGANAGESISVSLSDSVRQADIGGVYTTGSSFSGSSAFSATATYSVSIAVGSGTAVSVEGTFDSVQDLADQINLDVSGLSAWVETDSSGVEQLRIASNDTLTISTSSSAIGAAVSGLASATATTGSLSTLDVTSKADANYAIMKIDAALDSVNTLRGTLGAIQNRFESAIASTETAGENLTAARSRIQDADFAAETASMTSSQVLQQAGISVLSQANSSQQNILKLLQ
ncbi:MAG: flagellin [Steroidobacteraceae bacterium]